MYRIRLILINVLDNITQHLTGQHQNVVTVYPVVYSSKFDVMSKVACDWST